MFMPVFLTLWLHFYGSYSDRACFCCRRRSSQTGPRVTFLLCFMGAETPGRRVLHGFSFGKHTAKLNGWSINFRGIDLHQFCPHAHTRSHFIVNQSFWKHLTEGGLSSLTSHQFQLPASRPYQATNQQPHKHLLHFRGTPLLPLPRCVL